MAPRVTAHGCRRLARSRLFSAPLFPAACEAVLGAGICRLYAVGFVSPHATYCRSAAWARANAVCQG